MYDLLAILVMIVIVLYVLWRRKPRELLDLRDPTVGQTYSLRHVQTEKGLFQPVFSNGELYYRNISDRTILTPLMMYVLADPFERMFLNEPEGYRQDMTLDEAAKLTKDKLEKFVEEEKEADNWNFDELYAAVDDEDEAAFLPPSSASFEPLDFRPAKGRSG